DTSPATQTEGKLVSTSPRSRAVRADTVNTSCSSFGAADIGSPSSDQDQRVALLIIHPPDQFRITERGPVVPLPADEHGVTGPGQLAGVAEPAGGPAVVEHHPLVLQPE